MAVWQYDFKLVSKNNFKNIKLDTLVPELCNLFGLVIEESINKIVIGNYDSNNCVVYFNVGNIQEISCRLDMRSFNQSIIQKLKGIIENNNLKFLIIEEKILEGEEFVQKLLTSSASKFVENPKNFFEEL